jgi:hypothetical protein
MAFERGRGVAFGTTLLGNLAAIAGVVAAVTFGVSLHHLVDTPREQGWNWDVIVGNPNSQALAGDPAADPLHQKMVHLLATNKYVGAFSGLSLQDGITVDGHRVDIAAIETDRGSVFQPIVEGRAPRSVHEIVLGRDPLAQLHKGVGQTVIVRAGDHHTTMRIVGVSVQPTAGDMSPRLSQGGSVTLAALRPLAVGATVVQFAVRYRPGVTGAPHCVDGRPSAVTFSGRIRWRSVTSSVDYLPNVLAGLLVVLAVGALALSLIGSVAAPARPGHLKPSASWAIRCPRRAWRATALGSWRARRCALWSRSDGGRGMSSAKRREQSPAILPLSACSSSSPPRCWWRTCSPLLHPDGPGVRPAPSVE